MSISTQAHDNFSLWPMWHFSRRRALLQSYMHSQCLMWYLWFSYSVQSRKYCRNDHACTSSEYQAVSLLPHGLGTRIAVIQLFRSVSSCPYSKDGCFFLYKSATVWGACTLWMSSQSWCKSSISFWKAVMVLCSVKIYDFFFECFVVFASSGHCQTPTQLISGFECYILLP